MKKALNIIAVSHKGLRYLAIFGIVSVVFSVALITILLGFSVKLFLAGAEAVLYTLALWICGSVILRICRKLILKRIRATEKRQKEKHTIKWINLEDHEGKAADKGAAHDADKK